MMKTMLKSWRSLLVSVRTGINRTLDQGHPWDWVERHRYALGGLVGAAIVITFSLKWSGPVEIKALGVGLGTALALLGLLEQARLWRR